MIYSESSSYLQPSKIFHFVIISHHAFDVRNGALNYYGRNLFHVFKIFVTSCLFAL